MWRRQLPRTIAFGLMFAGFVLAGWGQSTEVNSFRASPSMFEGGLSSEDRARERHRAYDLKAAGVWLVLGGPVVWLLGRLLLRERCRAAPGTSFERDEHTTK
jgi:hypothetical protein